MRYRRYRDSCIISHAATSYFTNMFHFKQGEKKSPSYSKFGQSWSETLIKLRVAIICLCTVAIGYENSIVQQRRANPKAFCLTSFMDAPKARRAAPPAYPAIGGLTQCGISTCSRTLLLRRRKEPGWELKNRSHESK